MLKPISRLRSICKGDLNVITYSNVHRIRKNILHSIPVLSIFVLLGIMGYALDPYDFNNIDNEAYATESVNPTSSLVIDNGATIDNIAAAQGDTAYTSHIIHVIASDIGNYSLTITGPAVMTNGGTSIGGAGGKTGNNLGDNTWGYAWGDKNAVEANMAYNSFNGNAQAITGNPAVSNNQVDFEKKLAFAAKFSNSAVSGHYKANVKLNLTITPKHLPSFSNISDMQDMTADICRNAEIGDTANLRDSRDAHFYTIQKLSDGNCWMTQNLKLDLNVTGVATKEDSDNLPADYPASGIGATSAFSGGASSQAWASLPTVNKSYPGDGNGYQSAYGNYYTWCAATGGTCSDASLDGVNAPGSICPKGWKLPQSGATAATNDFAKLMGQSSVDASSWASNVFAGPPAYFTLGGANWYLVGNAYSDGLRYPGTEAYYWSRTIHSNSDYAYSLSLNSSNNLNPAANRSKKFGSSVRCVAYASPKVEGFGGIEKMQDMSPTVCNKASGSGELYDVRDGKTYTIQKLSDGNCWMTQNLKLDLNVTGVATKEDSDNLPADYPASGIGAVTQFSSTSTREQWYLDETYGNYYSWCATTGGTCSGITADNADATGSICPKGWKLPQAKANLWTNNDFIKLMQNTNYNGWNGNALVTISAFPTPNFSGKSVVASQLEISSSNLVGIRLGDANWLLAGNVNSSGQTGTGTSMLYWSRTASGSSTAYTLYYFSGSLYPARSLDRHVGRSVRCVAYSN